MVEREEKSKTLVNSSANKILIIFLSEKNFTSETKKGNLIGLPKC